MYPLSPRTLSYQSPAGLYRQRNWIWMPIGLTSFQFVWLYIASLTFYFGAPGSWHYFVYDQFAGRCAMFLFMGAPSMSSVGLAAAVFHRFRDVNRAAIVLAGVSVAIDAWLLGRLVWGTIIDPANPHGPGYWL